MLEVKEYQDGYHGKTIALKQYHPATWVNQKVE